MQHYEAPFYESYEEQCRAEEAFERNFFGENYEAVQADLGIDGDFEFIDYYLEAVSGMYLNKKYSLILKKLCEEGIISKSLQADLVIFDYLPNRFSNREEAVERFKNICDYEALFQPEETAYCFINRGSQKNTKGILISSKGIYFSANCKSEISFMAYDYIGGIVKKFPSNEIVYKKRNTYPLFADLDDDLASLLTLTTLYFKYGDSQITEKITTSIVSESEKKVKKYDNTVNTLGEIGGLIGIPIGIAAGIGFWVVIITLLLKACNG